MGKISIRYYLNKAVKGTFEPLSAMLSVEGDTPQGKEVEAYGLYYYITTRRKTIHRPSRFTKYVTEQCFRDEVEGDAGGRLSEFVRYESEAVKRIVQELEKDIQEGGAKTGIQFLTHRVYTAKDEYANNLNAYIDYYLSVGVLELLDKEVNASANAILADKKERAIQLLGEYAEFLNIEPKQGGRMERRYISVVGDEEALRPMYASLLVDACRKNTVNQGIRQMGLTPYEWVFKNGREEVWRSVEALRQIMDAPINKDRERDEFDKFIMNLDRRYYEEKIATVIDKVCSLSDRADKKMAELRVLV